VILLGNILAALAALSLALAIWQWLAARKFPLHQKITVPGFAPAVSILKPLKGCDDTTTESLASWFKQNHTGPVEILFGVADAADPVCEIVRRLTAENPAVRAQLIVCTNLVGANAKVAKLTQLEKFAAHDLILISDADVRVPPDFLANFVAPLRDEKNGLVNCFYRLANPTTNAMRCEAVAINADFWSQVLQSQSLKPMDFALGAAILVRRSALAEIGGFAPLADCLADDYQLGHRIFKNGQRIALCPVVVECWDSPQSWKQVWKHQLRWARTIRVCQPVPYFFSILSNVTLWGALWFAGALPGILHGPMICASTGSELSCCVSCKIPWQMIAASALLLFRISMALSLQSRFSRLSASISCFWLVPVRDLLNAVIWLAAFMGNTIEWRGRKMKVRADGTLTDA
jgi:ceramide glucosyltransferase